MGIYCFWMERDWSQKSYYGFIKPIVVKGLQELPADNMIPFIVIEIIKNGTELGTRVYRKPTNTGKKSFFHNLL